jgi:CheY-like chemotaxis protein
MDQKQTGLASLDEWPARSPSSPRTRDRRPGILVIDDDSRVRTLLKDALWQDGFIVWVANNGLQALALYRELRAHIDLVLLDVHMPGMDGPQTLAALRGLNSEVCCCFMNGDSGHYTENDLVEQGAICVLQKPFSLHEVTRFLWELVSVSETDAPTAVGGIDGIPELWVG